VGVGEAQGGAFPWPDHIGLQALGCYGVGAHLPPGPHRPRERDRGVPEVDRG